MKKTIYYLIAIGLIFISVFLSINFYITQSTKKHIYESAENVPSSEVAIILGARVYQNGSMSDILKDRILTALELYDSGKVKKILASGDHGRKEYDEVNTIKDFLLKNNVKPEDLFMDHAGFDTYDSLYRAKAIFKVESALIITQAFHLPRAVYIGRRLGIDAYGYKADRQPYLFINRYRQREKLANIKAFFNLLFNSKPKYLGDAIPISGDGRLSWD